MTRYQEIAAALAAPFSDHLVQSRKDNQTGRAMRWVNGATVQDRLDQVLGITGWRPVYREVGKGIECTISVWFEELGWLEKPDIGGYPGMTVKDRATGEMIEDEENDIKGAYSDALKRAASVWGVGRYLRLPPSAGSAPAPEVHTRTTPAGSLAPPPANRTHVNGRVHTGPPTTGKALFAWAKDREQEYQVGLIKYLNGWAKLQEFPGRMVDWDGDQVAQGHAEATRKLSTLNVPVSAYEEAMAN